MTSTVLFNAYSIVTKIFPGRVGADIPLMLTHLVFHAGKYSVQWYISQPFLSKKREGERDLEYKPLEITSEAFTIFQSISLPSDWQIKVLDIWMIYYDLKSILTALQLDFFTTTGGNGRRQMIGREQPISCWRNRRLNFPIWPFKEWGYFVVVIGFVWIFHESRKNRQEQEYLDTSE